jgi:hypothetical protein
MNKSRKGTKFEREVMEIFKKEGYGVMRSSASKGPYDVVLIKYSPENKRICFLTFVQCKIKKLSEKFCTSPSSQSTNSNPENPVSETMLHSESLKQPSQEPLY